MATKMKKTLAMVLAITMLVSQLALPAIAADGQESQTSENPVTTQHSSVETLSDGTQVATETTTTVSHEEAAGNPMIYEDQTTWTEETTVTKPNGDTEVTTTTGSETTEGDVIVNPDLTQTYTTEGSGSESTTVESSETSQVGQDTTVLDSTFETGGDAEYNTSDLPTEKDVSTDTGWQEGEVSTDTDNWTQGAVTEGEWEDGKTITSTTEGLVADPNLGADSADDVAIGTLTPGGSTVEVSVPVTLENVAAGLYPELFELKEGETAVPIKENGQIIGYSVTTKSGDTTTVKEVKSIAGGFEVTTTVTTDPGKDSTKNDADYADEDITYSDPTYTNANGAAGEKSSVKIDEFEAKLEQGETSTDADGNRTSVVTSTGTDNRVSTTTVKDVTDANGNKGYSETTVIKYEDVVTTEYNVPLTDAKDPSSIPVIADQVTVDYRYDQPEAADDVLALAVNNRDNGDGTYTTITVKEVLESNGSSSISDVAGYEVVETKTDKDGNVISTETKTHSNVVPNPVLDRDNGDGTFTNVSLRPITATQDTDYYKAGDVIGWTARTVLTDADGKVLETKERDVYGTEVTLTTTVSTNADDMTKTTTYERTDTYITNAFAAHYERNASMTATQLRTYVITEMEEIAQYLCADENPAGLTFIYQGKMLAVEEVEGEHGTTKTYAVKYVSMDQYDEDDGIQGTDYRDYEKVEHNYSGMYTTPGLNSSTWTYNGKGLLSIFQIQAGPNATDSNPQEGKMFRVVKGTEEQYVYCVEFSQNVQSGKSYSYDVYGNVTEEGTKTYLSTVTDAYLCSTALNGFWGTTSGIGSLEAVKDFLRRMGETAAAETLTAGEAVTATQAAIWHFSAGDKTDDFYSGKFVTFINSIDGNATRCDGNNATEENLKAVSTDSRVQNIYTLFDALVKAAKADAADDKSGAAQAINAENITAGQIVVKESMGDNKYKTDLYVQLDVSQSSINDDLMFTVTTADGTTYKYRLSGTCAEDETFVTMDASGNIVLPDVVIGNNTDVSVELSGRQTLDQGVSIYKSDASQDFIGLSTKLHDVALKFGYWLGLIDPEYDYSKTSTEKSKVNTVTYTTEAKRTDTRDTLEETHDAYKVDRTTYVSQLNGIVTETLKIDKKTLENVRWDFYYDYTLTVVDDEDGNGNDDEIILDDEVPLAAAPKTGDPSVVFAAMSALSMAGYSVLGLKRKDEE